MESNCASCHNAEGFVATVIPPHHDAGIGCNVCHAEHQGADFKPAEAALFTCTKCHNDANKNAYNGKRVGTPHGGTFGYPAANEKWIWKGLDENEWKAKQIAVDAFAFRYRSAVAQQTVSRAARAASSCSEWPVWGPARPVIVFELPQVLQPHRSRNSAPDLRRSATTAVLSRERTGR